jgi:hypothetical protein
MIPIAAYQRLAESKWSTCLHDRRGEGGEGEESRERGRELLTLLLDHVHALRRFLSLVVS